MAIGMTYDQYWYGDPMMVRAFYEADKIRQKIKDEEAWTLGAYFVKALESTVGNMFKESGSQPLEYPTEPFLITHEREKRKKKEEREKEEMMWAEAWMTQFVEAGKNWGKDT